MEISIKWNVCRVCLQEPQVGDSENTTSNGAEMRCIFTDAKLINQIYECAGIMMKIDDCLPQKICRRCLTELKYAMHFRTTCRNSDEYLQSVIQKTKSATSLFKLDKHREERIEFEDDDFEKYFSKDDIGLCDEEEAVQEIFNTEEGAQGDSNNCKRSLSKELMENAHKKSKTENVYVYEGEQRTIIPVKNENIGSSDKTSIENNQTEDAEGDADASEQITFKTGADETSEKEIEKEARVIQIFIDDDEEDDQEQEEIDENDMEELEEIEGKKRHMPKSTSECSIEEDGYIEENDEEHHSNLEDENEELNSYRKSIDTIKSFAGSIDDDLQTRSMCSNTNDIEDDADELFYILHESDIKQGREPRDYNDTPCTIEATTTEYITDEHSEPAEEQCDESVKLTKSPSNGHNIEYLVDNAKEEHIEIEAKNVPSVLSRYNTVAFKERKTSQRKKSHDTFFVCDVCGNNFTSRSLMNCHMKIHRNEKNYECELCYKRFNAACNLTSHMRIHTGEKRYECQFCGRRFTDRSTHIKHERIHTDEKPFTCNVCGKSFALSTTLKAHEKVHTGEKPYKCETCQKAFKLSHQLKAHFGTHLHKMIAAESASVAAKT